MYYIQNDKRENEGEAVENGVSNEHARMRERY